MTVGSQFKLGHFGSFHLHDNVHQFSIGNQVTIRENCAFWVGNNATVTIGNRVFMNNFCSINALESIEIGENTLFGEGVKIYDHNHAYTHSPEFTISHTEFTKKAVKIGKNCWLGSNVVVLKGVTIGDNVIVGAGCVVYQDVLSNTMIRNKQELITKEL